jgi:hypothetical protein
MSYSDPKRPSFVHWLRASGHITPDELGVLVKEWTEHRMKKLDHKVYTTHPTTWDQFVASRYARKLLAYQAYLRLIGAAPTFKKD